MKKIYVFILLVLVIMCMVLFILHNNSEEQWEENAKSIIPEITAEMEFEGWKNITWYKGLPDIDWKEGFFERMLREETENTFMYTGIGYTDGMYLHSETGEPTVGVSIVVRVAFDEENPKGKRLKVWYFSDSGRSVSSDDVTPHNPVSAHEILDSHDIGIWTYMFTY